MGWGVMGGGRNDGGWGSGGGGEGVMEWVGEMKRGEGGVVDSDEWGEGSGVGTYERGGSAARPSSSMWALIVCVHTRRLCARSLSMCALVVHVRARCPCARSLSCPWAFVMRGWRVVVV